MQYKIQELHDFRLIDTFLLPNEVKTALSVVGYKYAGELRGINPETISASSLTVQQAEDLLNTIFSKDPGFNVVRADKLLEYEYRPSSFLWTGVEMIDALFDGYGLPTGCITEIYGQPGIGKTHICKDIAISFQRKPPNPKSAWKCLYLDTDGGFIASRAGEMITAKNKRLPVDKILSNVHYVRITDLVSLLSFINQLGEILDDIENVKLVIIDNISFHFRVGFSDTISRSAYLGSIAQELRSLAYAREIPILITNSVTTKFFDCPEHKCGYRAGTIIVPALGDAWSSVPIHRIALYWGGRSRYAKLVKSSIFDFKSHQFYISDAGVCLVKNTFK